MLAYKTSFSSLINRPLPNQLLIASLLDHTTRRPQSFYLQTRLTLQEQCTYVLVSFRQDTNSHVQICKNPMKHRIPKAAVTQPILLIKEREFRASNRTAVFIYWREDQDWRLWGVNNGFTVVSFGGGTSWRACRSYIYDLSLELISRNVISKDFSSRPVLIVLVST